MTDINIAKLRPLRERSIFIINNFDKDYRNAVKKFLDQFELTNAPPIVENYIAQINEVIGELKVIEDSSYTSTTSGSICNINQLNICRHIRYMIDIHYAHIQLIITNHSKILGGIPDDAPDSDKWILIPLLQELLKYNDAFTQFSTNQLESLF